MWYTEPRDQRYTGTGVEDNEYEACICQSNILHVGGERCKDGSNKGMVMGRRAVNNMRP
jgi:hypothetical protein